MTRPCYAEVQDIQTCDTSSSIMAPANMLLAVHCKKGDHLDLKDPMWTYISATYSDQQAQDAADDLATVQQLRNDVVGLTGSLSDLRETLAR